MQSHACLCEFDKEKHLLCPQPCGMCEYQAIWKENSMKSVPHLSSLSLHQNAASGPDSKHLAASEKVDIWIGILFLLLQSVSGDRLQSW